MKTIEQLREATQDMDIPFVVILKRQSIRIYPNGTRIGLYYSEALNRYVTIPFESIGVSAATSTPMQLSQL